MDKDKLIDDRIEDLEDDFLDFEEPKNNVERKIDEVLEVENLGLKDGKTELKLDKVETTTKASNSSQEFQMNDVSENDISNSHNQNVDSENIDNNEKKEERATTNTDTNTSNSNETVGENNNIASSSKESTDINKNVNSNNNENINRSDNTTNTNKNNDDVLDSSSSKNDNSVNNNANTGFDNNLNRRDNPNTALDDRTLRDRVKDTRAKANEMKDKIQNFPENAKNKVDEVKQKANDIKDKTQAAKTKASNAIKNRPKNMKDLKSKGSNVKEKLKNGAKRRAQQAGNKIKESAKDAAKESLANNEMVQKAQKAIDTAKKVRQTAQKTVKVAKKTSKTLSLIVKAIAGCSPVLITVLIIVVIVACIAAMFPGINGSTKEESSKYVDADQKTIEKLHKLFKDYPNADPTLAMAAVVYPYFDILWDTKTRSLVSPDYIKELEEEDAEAVEEAEDSDDTEDIEGDDKETKFEDEYLVFFRKYKRRKNLKTLLKKGNSGDETLISYLKDTYFSKDKGYKKMFDDSKDSEKLKESIINNLDNIKSLFANYAYEDLVCSTTLVSAGNVEVSELLKSVIYIDNKVDSCTTSGSSMVNCASWHGEPIPIGEYVKGVVWTEMSVYESINIEKVKAQMVAAKSYVLGRYKSMGWELQEPIDGSDYYVIPIRSNTNDQDYCDYKVGCPADKISGNEHVAANEKQQQILEEAWQATKDLYIFDKNGTDTKGPYCADRIETEFYDCSWCTKGNCLAQKEVESLSDSGTYTVESILTDHYYNLSLVTIEGGLGTMQTAGATVCSNRNTNFAAERNKIASLILTMSDQGIPYYIGGLADSKELESNNFGTEIEADTDGNTKKGLGEVGFANFVYWNVINENFGNTNDINPIISDDMSYEIAKAQLLIGDIGISDDNSLIGIYLGDEKWGYADSVSKKVVINVDNRFTKYRRLNYFKDEIYNFTIRETTPTQAEWAGQSWFQSFGKNLGQCPWYAQNRAAEIIQELYDNSSITKDTYNKLINRIYATNGDGIDFQPGYTAQTTGGYSGGDDLSQIKPGTFLGMSGTTKHGHVAVVEYVDPVKDVIIITDGWSDDGSGTWAAVRFANSKELSFSNFISTRYFRNHYVYGYLYFLGD